MSHDSPQHPNFLIIGAAKSGTTSLYFYLRQHPDIYLPKDVKEPGFLCFMNTKSQALKPPSPYPDMWKGVVKDRQEYLSLFEGVQTESRIGEATVEYLYLPEQTAEGIKSLSSDAAQKMKFIAILRNPVERVWSHYNMFCRDGYEHLPIDEAVSKEVIQQRLSDGWHPSYDYIGFGKYYESIKYYQDHYGKDNVLTIRFDDLANNTDAVCAKVFQFLGVDSSITVNTQQTYNVSGKLKSNSLHEMLFVRQYPLKSLLRKIVPYEHLQRLKHRIIQWNSAKKEMPHELKIRLFDEYHEDIRQLQSIIDCDLDTWLDQ